MSDERERQAAAARPGTQVLRAQIQTQLADLERAVGGLGKRVATAEVDEKRTHTAEGRSVHLELQSLLADVRRREAEARLSAGMVERGRLSVEQRAMSRRTRELEDRCADLRDALVQERQRSTILEAEVDCLDEQVVQLQAIIERLLDREHGH